MIKTTISYKKPIRIHNYLPRRHISNGSSILIALPEKARLVDVGCDRLMLNRTGWQPDRKPHKLDSVTYLWEPFK